MDNLLSVIRSRDWGVGGFSLYPGLAWSLPTVTSCCPSTPSWEHIRWGAGRAPDACAPSHLLYLIPLALTHPPPCGKAQHPRAGASSSEEPTTPFPTVYPSLQDQSREKYWSPWDEGRKERKHLKCESLYSPVHDVVGVQSDFYIEIIIFFKFLTVQTLCFKYLRNGLGRVLLNLGRLLCYLFNKIICRPWKRRVPWTMLIMGQI